jgi:predicted ribosome quality control (RQC) complex YloA/Tae2 family protein
MSLRPSEIAQVVAELDEGLRGAVLQKASMPSSQLAYLELRQPGRSTLLCLCAQRETRRISVAELRPPGSPQPPALQRLMRTQLVGFRLTGIAIEGVEVRLTFEKPEAKRVLALQLHGEGELALLTDDGRAVATGTNRRYQPQEGTLEQSAPSRLAPEGDAPFPLARAAEALEAGVGQAQDVDARRRALLAPLKARLTRLVRTVAKVTQEADRGPAAEAHRRMGELLTQNLFRIRRGDRQVTLTEYTAEGPLEVTVALDPSRTPQDEAERHFHQYRRLMRGSEKAKERLAQLTAERAQVEAALERAAQLGPEELAATELSPGERAEGRARPARPQHRPFKEYRAAGGERIWVGRGGAENDALTFQVARPQDLWLHVRGVPGAHVVVPLERNAEIPQELLLDAAHLALHHSPLKGEPKGEVSYVLAKFVRKQKGGAPGQVVYTREKTFVVRTEPARLERLLASRVGG